MSSEGEKTRFPNRDTRVTPPRPPRITALFFHVFLSAPIQFLLYYWGLFFIALLIVGTVKYGDLSHAHETFQTGWAALGREAWRIQFGVWFGPVFGFFPAAALSGVFRAAVSRPRFPWGRLLAFVIVFWILDGAALGVCIASPKISLDAKKVWLDSIGMVPVLFHIWLAPLGSALINALFLRMRYKSTVSQIGEQEE